MYFHGVINHFVSLMTFDLTVTSACTRAVEVVDVHSEYSTEVSHTCNGATSLTYSAQKIEGV